jgi:hypothetical protein
MELNEAASATQSALEEFNVRAFDMSIKNFHRPREKGNVLFIILIAVVLFGALSYAVTRTGRFSQTVMTEEDDLAAADLISYATSVKQAIIKLKMVNGCADTEISFANTVYKSTTGTTSSPESNYPSAPTNKRCHIFDQAGAAMSPVIMDKLAIPNQTFGGLRTGHASLNIANVPSLGTSESDLLLAFPHIKRSVCLSILKKLNMTVSLSAYGNCTWTTWTGSSFAASPSCPANVTGLKTWCADDSGANQAAYFYSAVLIR